VADEAATIQKTAGYCAKCVHCQIVDETRKITKDVTVTLLKFLSDNRCSLYVEDIGERIEEWARDSLAPGIKLISENEVARIAITTMLVVLNSCAQDGRLKIAHFMLVNDRVRPEYQFVVPEGFGRSVDAPDSIKTGSI